MRPFFLSAVLLLGFARPAAAPAAASAPSVEEIKFAVTDLVGLEELHREFGQFVEVMEKATGFKVKFYPVTNRQAASEALRFRRVDFVLTGPAEYVVMRKRTKAVPVVAFSRPDYFSSVIVMADSRIRSPDQLKGKKVGFSSVGSTSGHLGPMQVLADYGLDPTKQIKPIHLKTQLAFASLRRGDIAALGFGAEKFNRLRDAEYARGGLAPGSFRVICRGPDLPNDILIAGAHVDESVVDRLRSAFVAKSSELIKAMLVGDNNQKYKGMKFLDNVSDGDYDYVRKAFATAGYPEYSDFIGK